MNQSTDTYQIVTDRIIAKLEAGTIPWKHFASNPLTEPKNFVSKRAYHGINRLLLSGSKHNSDYYLTFNQCADLGGRIKKGAKSEIVVFWRFIDVEDKENPGETKQIPFLKYYRVFSIEDAEGIDYAKLPEQSERDSNPIEEAEAIVANMPNRPRLVIDQTPKAYYSPSEDFIHMTERSACVSDSAYYDTLFHECVHATGHKSRLNRMEGDTAWHRFGSKPYANEELVAEMGAAMLCEEAGIFQETEENSAAYLANWLTKLENDNRLVIHAAAKAQKAADWILGHTEQPRVELPMAA
jgi:antirestriction protein ArdC